jgi:hypothetical protein
MRERRLTGPVAVLVLSASISAIAQTVTPCPSGLPSAATCYSGRDANGAHYWIARPSNWNGMLVMHSHGGPRLDAPGPQSEVEDLRRWAVIVDQGYALAASSYREGGYIGLATAAEDTENLRRLYVEKFGPPRRTLAHGQSWGGGVTAYLIERYAAAADGKRPYDGALLSSGLVAGNELGYAFRADLRAVYQYYCHNMPRPDEAQYPVWMGMPTDSRLGSTEVEQRVDECTGLQTPAALRTDAQKRKLANILGVIRIPERSLLGNMYWATFMFRDIVAKRLDGKNPFTNEGVHYTGSDDDDALNRGVERFRADPGAAKAFADDGRLAGRVSIPVLSVHAIDDPIVFVEQDSAYREVMDRGGSGPRLVQTWTDEHEHGYLSSPEYAALLAALVKWIDADLKPDLPSTMTQCAAYSRSLDGACHFAPGFRPRPLSARVPPRVH